MSQISGKKVNIKCRAIKERQEQLSGAVELAGGHMLRRWGAGETLGEARSVPGGEGCP